MQHANRHRSPHPRAIICGGFANLRGPNACPLGVARVPYALPVGRCQPLRSEPGPLVPFDVNDGRIVASGDNATVILDPEGRELRSIPVRATSAQLAGERTRRPRRRASCACTTHRAVHFFGDGARSAISKTSPRVSPRISSGADFTCYGCETAQMSRSARATRARFGDSGLYYSYEGEYPWRGRIRFVPFGRLEN